MKTEISVDEILEKARKASQKLANITARTRDDALNKMAQAIESRKDEILEANRRDLENAEALLKEGRISEAIVSRLKLSESKIRDIVNGIKEVSHLDDPLGRTTYANQLDKDLELYRVTCPIGVIAVIFESRPDALAQIASLTLKTSNVVILKGGREAENSLNVLFDCLETAATEAGIPSNSLNLLHTREDVSKLLKAEEYVDLIIPRGSNSLVRHIQDNTRIPVLGHADGICHLYVHEDADLEMAAELTLDSKTQYPSACNAIETLLVNRKVMDDFLPDAVSKLVSKDVEVRLDATAHEFICKNNSELKEKVEEVTDADWGEEYCELIISVKVVDTIDDAIAHINHFGSGHTDCIVTKSKQVFDEFFKSVDSAGVFWNASTRFADGFRYGFGAEVGIATGKLHPRGPVGLDGLVTYKYRLEGNGQIVATYSGPDAKPFIHKRIV